jgi:hypothetical protein
VCQYISATYIHVWACTFGWVLRQQFPGASASHFSSRSKFSHHFVSKYTFPIYSVISFRKIGSKNPSNGLCLTDTKISEPYTSSSNYFLLIGLFAMVMKLDAELDAYILVSDVILLLFFTHNASWLAWKVRDTIPLFMIMGHYPKSSRTNKWRVALHWCLGNTDAIKCEGIV